MTDAWRNRITGHDVKPASWFMANPLNWRIHPKPQQAALSGVLEEVGWVQDVLVNERTGNMIDGHLRVTLALRQGDDTPIPVTLVDLSEEEEALILATLDPLSAMAATDAAKLDELLRDVQTGDAAVMDLLTRISGNAPPVDYEKMWEGMPEFGNEPKAAKSLYVHFVEMEDYRDFAELIGQNLTDKTASIWYPERKPQERKLLFGGNDES